MNGMIQTIEDDLDTYTRSGHVVSKAKSKKWK